MRRLFSDSVATVGLVLSMRFLLFYFFSFFLFVLFFFFVRILSYIAMCSSTTLS